MSPHPYTWPVDRHIFLSLMDSAILSRWISMNKDDEAIALHQQFQELSILIAQQEKKGARVYAQTLRIKCNQIMQNHSVALHLAAQFKGQYMAYQAIRKYMHRCGYRFV